MEEKEILRSRIKELSARALNDSYVTHTAFLSMSEQALFFSILKEEKVNLSTQKYAGVSYLLYGGHQDDDRKVLFFLPYYLTQEEEREKEAKGETFSCLFVYPKNERFADVLTHRDYLGALMHLGVKREMYGDILTDGKKAYIFIFNSVIQQVKEELVKIKHTTVQSEILKPQDCSFSLRFEEKDINVPSLRLDAILSETFHISRRDGQILIGSECVFVNGMTTKNNSYILKENDRVSVKGKGKFLFLCSGNVSKKGRLFVKIKKYC